MPEPTSPSPASHTQVSGPGWAPLLEIRARLVDTMLLVLVALVPLVILAQFLIAWPTGQIPALLIALPGLYLFLAGTWLLRKRLPLAVRGHTILLLLSLYWLGAMFSRGPILPASTSLGFMIVVMAGMLLGSRAGWIYLAGSTLARLLGLALDLAGGIPAFPRMEQWGRSRIWEYWGSMSVGGLVAGIAVLLVIDRIMKGLEDLVGTLEQEVADRRRAETDLAASETRLRAAFEQSAVGFCRVDLTGRFLKVNHRAAEILGYRDPEELQGRSYLDLTHPDDREFSQGRARALVGGEYSTYGIEKRYLRKDGTPVLVNLSVSMIRGPGGEPESTFVVMEDITHRRQAEHEHARLENQLLQSQKLESMGRLAGGVAHDVNNMITAVLGHASLMKELVPRDGSLAQHLDGIEKASWRSSSIVRQLLTFSRQGPARPEVLNLSRHISETGRMLAPLLGEDIRVDFRPAEDLRDVLMDPTQLDQVVMNLAVNARDAMPEGGILTLETANLDLTEADCRINPLAEPGPYVQFRISDEGVGMDPATRDRIFEPFFTTKEPGRGTGLGLATVFGIIRQAGGFISVYSEPGRGSTFKICLPAADADGRPLAAVAPVNPEPAHRGGTVLVVEDAEALRQVIAGIITNMGYQVLCADSPEAALDVCGQPGLHLDLLLTDMVMPGMGGRQLYDRILETHPGLPAIFMSGYSREAIARQGTLEDGLAFLQKPFTSQDLSRKMAAVLGN